MNGSCGKRPIGAVCTAASQCASAFCADGFCCNVDLHRPLRQLQPERPRRHLLADGQGVADPHKVCTATDKSTCGQTGACDGLGGCAKYAAETVCTPPACSGDRLNTAGTCDGLGTCRPQGVQACVPYRCSGTACVSHCASDADCVSGHTCVNGSCGPKAPGQPCSAGSECGSGFCADGVCCTTACTGSCRSCALSTSLGTCAPVPLGAGDPHGMCTDRHASSCGTDGTCDGSGGCHKYPAGTECAPEKCASGVYTPVSTCDANGNCRAPDAIGCAPYVCNGARCYGACSGNDTACSPGNVCVQSSCGLKPNGAFCSTGTECKSAQCAQGVCCATACAGSCFSCAMTGTMGLCTAVPTGLPDPAGLCTDKGPTSCGSDGKCQAGACQKYLQGTACANATCPMPGSTFTAGGTCDGAGTCSGPGRDVVLPVRLWPQRLPIDLRHRRGLRTAGHLQRRIVRAQAEWRRLPGRDRMPEHRVRAGRLLRDHLRRRVSVLRADGDQGHLLARGRRRRRSDRPVHGPGRGQLRHDRLLQRHGGVRRLSVRHPVRGARLRDADDGEPGPHLRRSRQLQTGHDAACAPFACNNTTQSCVSVCTADADCAPGQFCTNGSCGLKRLGQICSLGGECASGNCVDGVCCSTASCTSCQVCNLTGSAGTCGPVPLGSAEPHQRCAAAPPCGFDGTCNGAGACRNTSAGTSCGAASCTNATSTAAGACDGAGTCVQTPVACPGHLQCDATTCLTTCTTGADCVTGYTCQSGICTNLKPLGTTCTGGGECLSGLCTEGVCCGSASCGACASCNVTGKAGTCTALAPGTTVPASMCPDMGSASCGTNGTCDGSGHCATYPAGTTCAPAACTPGTATLVATSKCDGAGKCAPGAATDCTPQACASGACTSGCVTPADCAPGYTCAAPADAGADAAVALQCRL